MPIEIGRSTQNFPNGSSAVTVTTGILPPANSPPGTAPTNVVSVTTITPGPKGEMPPGYPAVFLGAIVAGA